MSWPDSYVWLCSMVRKVRRPAIGIMARPRVAQGQFTGKQGPVLFKYLEMARQMNAHACVFDPTEVDTIRGRLIGYVLDPSARKEQPRVQIADLPLPLVVYDQLLSRRFENSPSVVTARAYLSRFAEVFNDGYFDKWEVHQWLLSSPALKPYLPRTEQLSAMPVLRRFMLEHPIVFVKPIHGSLGLGITRIIHKDGLYQATLRGKKGNEEEFVAATVQDLYTHFHKRWSGKRHIVQEGLPLYSVGGRPVDVRVIMQKNEQALWQLTKLFVRMAGTGEFISNLTTGGEALPLSQLAMADQSLNLPRIKRDIRQLANRISQVVEEESGRLLGELGIDVGLSVSGHPFVIEINSKPWKTPETVNGSSELVELSFERPIRFALHLAQTADARRESDR